MYYEAGHDHLNLGEFEPRFVMLIFRFYCSASWSRDLMLVMYYRDCMDTLCQVIYLPEENVSLNMIDIFYILHQYH